MRLNRRETQRITLDEVAELYDRIRPGYPNELFDDLFTLANFKPSTAVLEIGCGTGQASLPLARRGCRLTCVEIGEHLAELARRNLAKYSSTEVITAAFETWEPARATFDMVFAATAWHWLDPAVRYLKAAHLLKPGGALAIISGGHVYPEDLDPFFSEIQDCYNALGEGYAKWPPPRPEDVTDLREEIEGRGAFEGVCIKRYLWTRYYNAEQYIASLNTFSDHRAMEESKRDILFDEISRRINARPDKRVRKHYLSILNFARLKMI